MAKSRGEPTIKCRSIKKVYKNRKEHRKEKCHGQEVKSCFFSIRKAFVSLWSSNRFCPMTWHLLLFSIDSKVGGVCQQLQLSDHAPLSQFARFSPYQPNRAHVGPPQTNRNSSVSMTSNVISWWCVLGYVQPKPNYRSRGYRTVTLTLFS